MMEEWTIFIYIVPLLFFLLLNVWVVAVGKCSFGNAIPVTFIGTTLVMYFSQLIFHSFRGGFWLLILFAFMAIPLLIIMLREETFRNHYFSIGFTCVLLLFFLFAIVDNQRCFSQWDEFSHWGKMIKEMVRLDHFYAEDASDLLVHKEYPPFSAVFEVLWCKLIGTYSEAQVTLALHFMEFSLFLPVLAEYVCAEGSHKEERESSICGKRGVLYALDRLLLLICVMVSTLLLVLYFDKADTFPTIYTDILLPLLYAYATSLLLDEKQRKTKFGYCALLLSESALLLTKQMGIAFLLLVWMLFILEHFFVQKDFLRMTKKEKIQKIAATLGIVIVPVLVNRTWSLYLRQFDLSGQFDFDKMKPADIILTLTGNGSEEQKITFSRYLHALAEVRQSAGYIKLTYVTSVLLAGLILFCIYILFKHYINNRECSALAFLFICGGIGYAFTMLVLYLFCYSKAEMLELAGYSRYMSSYLMSQFLILLYFGSQSSGRCFDSNQSCYGLRKKNLLWLFVIGILSFLMYRSMGLGNLTPQSRLGEPEKSYRLQAEEIQSETFDGARILLISSENCKNMYYLNYYMENRKMDARYLYANVADKDMEDSEFWIKLKTHICENDYVYVYDATHNLNSMLGDWVQEGKFVSGSLYRVDRKEDGVEAKMVRISPD